MKKNWIIIGALSALIMLATLGAVIAAEEAGPEPVANDLEDELADLQLLDEDVYFLVTNEDQQEIREATGEMIREEISESLEATDLTDEEIMEVEELLESIHVLRQEIRETVVELREQGMEPSDIRQEIEPMMTELRDMQETLRDTLAEHGIRIFEGRGPGFHGPGMARGEGNCERNGHQFRGPRFGEPGNGEREFPGPRP